MLAVSALFTLLLTASAANQATSVLNLPFNEVAKQADSARAADKLEEAIDLYRRGLKLRPAWADGWWSLGSLLYDQDRFGEAEVAFRRFIDVTGKSGAAYAFLGLCEYEAKDYDQALRHFRSWARAGWTGPPELSDVAIFHFALLLTRDSRFVEALYLLATEGDKHGSSPGITEAMGLASLRMSIVPEQYTPEKRELVWLAGAAAFYGSGHSHDFGRADEYAQKLLLHYDREPNVHYFRGTLFNFEHKTAEAAEEFRRELQMSPQHVPAMLDLASIQLTEGQFNEALSLASHAAAIAPKNASGWHILGQASFGLEKFADSARELQTAKQLAPDAALIRLHLARAYTALGQKRLADREVAAFKLLKDKEQVLAPAQEKLRPQSERPK